MLHFKVSVLVTMLCFYLHAHSQNAAYYESICDAYMQAERYAEACEECKQAMDLAWEEKLNDTTMINTAVIAGNAYFYANRYYEAEAMYAEALAYIKQKVEDPVWIFDIMYAMVIVTEKTENLELQNIIAQEAIAYAEAAYGYPNDYLVVLYRSISFYYSNKGDFNTGERYLQKAFDVYTDLGYGKDAGYADLLVFAAGNYFSVGKYTQCIESTAEAITIFKSTSGYASSICSSIVLQANCYFSNQDYEGSMNTALEGVAYLDSLPTLEEKMSNAMMYALLVVNLDLTIGTTIADETGLLEALKIGLAYFDTIPYSDPYNLVNSAIGLGNYYIQKQEWDSVQVYYNLALQNTLKYYGKGDIIYMYCQSVLASSAEHLGQIEKAKNIYLEIIDYSVSFLNSHFLFVSESEKEYLLNEFTTTHNNFLYFFYRFHRSNPGMENIVAETDLFLRGLLLQNITSLRNRIQNEGTEEEVQLFQQWLQMRQQAASLSAQNPDASKQLEQEAEVLEKKLPETFKTNITDTSASKWSALVASLDKNEAAIQFIDLAYANALGTNTTSYFALLSLPGQTHPEVIKLFSDDALYPIIEKQKGENERTYIQRMYSFPDLDFPDDTMYYQGDKLFEIIWEPLEAYLQNVNTIYYTATGVLNQLAIHALPINEKEALFNKYRLVMKTNLTYAHVDDDKKINAILLAGGINYESAASISDAEYFALAVSDSTSNRGGTWKALPGTLTEIEKIESFAQDNKTQTKMLKGSDASEQAIKNEDLINYDVLHIATHGYFFPDAATLDGTAAGIYFRNAANPLIRSGIILAGGNNTWINGKADSLSEDGILTAYEISNLNLLNTQLVVLSACETGLGDIKGTEGVYGLQRAFQMAGAKQLLVSLWKIPDQYTAEFMQVFYTALFSGQNAENSLHAARMHMQKKTDAYNWAAFVLVQ